MAMSWQVFSSTALKVLILLGSTGSFTNAGNAINVTCTAPAVSVNSTGNVTCHFSSDVIHSRPVSLTIEFYPLNKESSSEQRAECNWIHTEDNHCQTRMPGHKFYLSKSPDATGNSTDFILQMVSVTERDAGRYLCQQMSGGNQREVSSHACFLTVTAAGRSELSPVDTDKGSSHLSTSKTDKGHSELSTVKTDLASATSPVELSTLLPAILVPVAVIIVTSIVLILLWLRHKRRTANREQPKSDEERSHNTPFLPAQESQNEAQHSSETEQEVGSEKEPEPEPERNVGPEQGEKSDQQSAPGAEQETGTVSTSGSYSEQDARLCQEFQDSHPEPKPKSNFGLQ